MSNVFRGYVKEFKECLDEARKRLSEGHQGDPNAARLAILDAEKFYRDADQIVRQMQLAGRSAETPSGHIQREIDGFKQEMNNLKREIDVLKERADRSELLGGTDEEAIGSVEERAAMRNDKQRLLGATNMLVGAHVTANAALDTGRDTLAELGRQRERMEQSRLSIQGIKTLIQDSGRIMRSMWNGNYAETAVKLAIVVVLIFLIFFISYLRWFRHSNLIDGGGSPVAAPSNATITPVASGTLAPGDNN